MCGFHGWLVSTHKKMALGQFNYTGTQMRIANEVPTILLIIIVISVIIKY
jgi:putative membrane protein